MTGCQNRIKTRRSQLGNQSGQSAVEYLIVVGALVSALVAAPSAFNMVRGMMHNKYHSYSFGVAISDPPTSDFDAEVKRDAKAIKEVTDVLTYFIEHPSLPKPELPDWPDLSDISKMVEK